MKTFRIFIVGNDYYKNEIEIEAEDFDQMMPKLLTALAGYQTQTIEALRIYSITELPELY